MYCHKESILGRHNRFKFRIYQRVSSLELLVAHSALWVDHVARIAFLNKNSVKNVKYDTKLF